jgi:hypothetical protein
MLKLPYVRFTPDPNANGVNLKPFYAHRDRIVAIQEDRIHSDFSNGTVAALVEIAGSTIEGAVQLQDLLIT